MILVAIFWAFAGFSLEVELELGWAGRPVLGAVNPLWVTLSNPGPTLLSGELRLLGGFGSPWRGESTYTLVLPFSIGPFAKTKILLPWPVQVGSFSLKATAFSGTERLGEKELRFSPEPGPLRAGIGPPSEPVDVAFTPAELPSDPLLLSPFSELHALLPLNVKEEVVRAWRAFLSKEGMRVEAEAFRGGLAKLRPPSPLWWALAPGLFLYLLGLSLALPRLSRNRPIPLLALLGLFLVLSGFYAVLGKDVVHERIVFVRIEKPGFTRFCMELLGIVSWRREGKVVRGWWVELLPPREWAGRDLVWRFVEGEWHTELRLEPGVPRLLLRLSQKEWEGPGEPIAPPIWLRQSLALPWEEARVDRLFSEEPGAEASVVRLP